MQPDEQPNLDVMQAFSNHPPLSGDAEDLSPMERAILQTVAYVDMYDYPLTSAEIHRYLVGQRATQRQVDGTLENGRLVGKNLEHVDGYFTLPGRSEIVEKRHSRAAAAEALWPLAVRYGQWTAALPFVRMVAVTGSLAVNNPDEHADIDYLIITETGRLWLCRALVVLLVRYAANRGITLCPNYFLSERALAFDDRNLYTAHEIVQMVPLAGGKVYDRLLEENRWAMDFLPNATPGLPPVSLSATAWRAPVSGVRRLGEAVLRTPLGARLEQWEMKRKVRRFSEQAATETAFSADYCKGHFEAHGQQAMLEFRNRWQALGSDAQDEPVE